MTDQTPAEELRELIREAHGLLKDLRAERRAVEQLLDSIPEKIDDRVKEHLAAELEALSTATRQAMDAATTKVAREFDRLESLFTGRSPAQRRQGKPPLEDLIRAHPNAKGAHLD